MSNKTQKTNPTDDLADRIVALARSEDFKDADKQDAVCWRSTSCLEVVI
jgi:hypothetical protein